MNGNIVMKPIAVSRHQVHVTVITLNRSLGQRSRSDSDGYRNIGNSVAYTNISCSQAMNIRFPRLCVQRSRSWKRFPFAGD